MKKPKTLEYKLEKAIRLIWSRSAERRQIIKAALAGQSEFTCPGSCNRTWPSWAADVDHEPPLGGLQNWRDTADYIYRSFYGPQHLMCKGCHKKKTASQRKRSK